MTVLYDAGALIAADRNVRDIWTEHLAHLSSGETLVTTAPVVAQISRSPRQANLRRFLSGCAILPLADSDAHGIGALLAASGASDVVDAHVVRCAVMMDAEVVTSDVDDIEWLAAAAGVSITVRAV